MNCINLTSAFAKVNQHYARMFISDFLGYDLQKGFSKKQVFDNFYVRLEEEDMCIIRPKQGLRKKNIRLSESTE